MHMATISRSLMSLSYEEIRLEKRGRWKEYLRVEVKKRHSDSGYRM